MNPFVPLVTTSAARPGDTNWRQDAEVIFQYLHRDMSDHLVQEKIYYPRTWGSRIPRTVPYIHRVTKEISTSLYLLSPGIELTKLEGGKVSRAVADEIRQDRARRRLNRTYRTAHEHLIALRQATIWEWGPRKTLVIPPHHQWVKRSDPLGSDVEDVEAWYVWIPFRNDDTSLVVEWGVAEITPTTARWTQGPLKGRGVWDDSGVNPLGEIPVCLLRDSEPEPGDFWLHLPMDRLDAQRAINHDATDLGHLARTQSYGHKYRKGADQSEEVQEGPEWWQDLPPDGEIGVVSPDADLPGYQTVADRYLDGRIADENLNPSSYKRSAGVTALAKLIELADREPQRLRHREEFELAEQRGYDLRRKWRLWERGEAGTTWPEARVSVTYRQPQPPVDPMQALNALEKAIQLDRTSIARDIADAEGIPLEDAKKLHETIREENGRSDQPEPPPEPDAAPEPVSDESPQLQALP